MICRICPRVRLKEAVTEIFTHSSLKNWEVPSIGLCGTPSTTAAFHSSSAPPESHLNVRLRTSKTSRCEVPTAADDSVHVWKHSLCRILQGIHIYARTSGTSPLCAVSLLKFAT